MILRSIRLMAVVPGQGNWSALLRELVQKYRPNVVCLIDASATDLNEARSVELPKGVVLMNAGERGWHQAGPLLLVGGGNEVLVVGVVSFCAASVLASIASTQTAGSCVAVMPGEPGYTVVSFQCAVGHVLGVKLETMH